MKLEGNEKECLSRSTDYTPNVRTYFLHLTFLPKQQQGSQEKRPNAPREIFLEKFV